MKILIAVALVASLSFSQMLSVIKGDVKISINKKEYDLQKGKSLELEDGDSIVFISGEGRVIIGDTQLSKSTRKEYKVPVTRGYFSNMFKKIKEGVEIAYLDTKESSKNGVSTKGAKQINDNSNIILKENSTMFVIASEEFGPHPVTIKLKDEKGNVVDTFVNENDDITIYKVSSSFVENGFKVEVFDGFDEVLLKKNIVKK